MNYQDLWSKACDHLKSVLNSNVYARWIEIIQPQALNDLNLVLSVDNEFCKNWIEDNYSAYILDALKASGAPADISLKFTVEAKPDEVPQAENIVLKPELNTAA